MRRVSEVLSWLCGTFAMLSLVAAMLLASTPVYSQGPAPDPQCAGCIGTTFSINGQTYSFFCNGGNPSDECKVTAGGVTQPGSCIQDLANPSAPCQGCSCKKVSFEGGEYCRCKV
jgi:hypothetical protein